MKVSKAIPVPIHQVESAEIEIMHLLRAGVIKKVTEPTDWTSPALFVTKGSGALRLVTDFRGLNRYLERPTHPFLTTEVLSKMVRADSRYFAKVDLVSAYHQVPLAEESQLLTMFLISAGKM